MSKIIFTRHIRRQGTSGNLYITIPIYEERKNNIEDGDLVEVSLKKITSTDANFDQKVEVPS